MGTIKNIKKEIITKLSAVSTLAKVYDYERLHPEQFPCAFVTFSSSDNEFFTTSENKRVFGYRVLVLAQIGQDRSDTDRLELAEQTIQDVTGDILDTLDSNITLDDAVDVVFVEASVGEPGYVEYEGGFARSVEVQVRVHSVYLV